MHEVATSRRAVMRALVTIPTMIAVPAAAHGVGPSVASAADAEIVQAFKERQRLLAICDHPETTEADYSAAIEGAGLLEAFIELTQAQTVHGIICKLWAAVTHIEQGRELDAAMVRGDYLTIHEMKPSLDWSAVTTVDAALQLERLAGVQMLTIAAQPMEIGA